MLFVEYSIESFTVEVLIGLIFAPNTVLLGLEFHKKALEKF